MKREVKRERFVTTLSPDILDMVKEEKDRRGLSNMNDTLEQIIKDGLLDEELYQGTAVMVKLERTADIDIEELQYLGEKLSQIMTEMSAKIRAGVDNEKRASCLAVYGMALRLSETLWQIGDLRRQIIQKVSEARGQEQ